MNRVELYVDRENRLTLDFFYKIDDDNWISQFKGEKCYGIISKLCEIPIINMKENSETKEISLTFDNCILNINEYDKTFAKRGTGPIKANLVKYYETQKKDIVVPKKDKNQEIDVTNKVKNQDVVEPKGVKRINKYLGREIIAGALVLSVLGAVIAIEHSRSKKIEIPETTESTTYSTEIDLKNEATEIISDITIGQLNVGTDKTSSEVVDVKTGKDEELSNLEIFIPFEDRSDTEKARITKAYYGETIERYAKRYGVDPRIMIAIATQERGIHSDVTDRGGATGLMQIQNAVWLGENVTAYNYDLQRYETVLIDRSKLSDVFYNIKIGCMYFQNCMNYMDGNILAAIQCYNYGTGNMQTVLHNYSLNCGKTNKEILLDISDCGWMEYRTTIPRDEGDKNYVENVISWIGSTISFENPTSSNENFDIIVTNSKPEKIK